MNEYANRHRYEALMELFILVMVIFLSLLVGALATYGLSYALGVESPQSIMSLLSTENTALNRQLVRAFIVVNHLFTFVIPVLAFAWLLYRAAMFRHLGLRLPKNMAHFFWGALLMVAAFPVAQWLLWLNQQLLSAPPAFAMDEQVNKLTKNLLVMEASNDLIFNILVIALIPALGEELLFRGAVQKALLKLYRARRYHAAIWTTAVLFGAMHLQFEGLLPRIFLGAVLGYLCVWTGNLWVSIWAHFLNNGAQIAAKYLYDAYTTNPPALDETEVAWYWSAIGALAMSGIVWQLYRTRAVPD